MEEFIGADIDEITVPASTSFNTEDGVLRCSMGHYNTANKIGKPIHSLDQILD